MALGATIIRICICEAEPEESPEVHVPQLFCQACSLWPAIRAETDAGGDRSPDCAGWTPLTGLGAVAPEKGWGLAEKLGTRAFRRAAVRALVSARGLSDQLFKAGLWRFSAFQLFLDVGREESQAAADFLTEAPDVET